MKSSAEYPERFANHIADLHTHAAAKLGEWFIASYNYWVRIQDWSDLIPASFEIWIFKI